MERRKEAGLGLERSIKGACNSAFFRHELAAMICDSKSLKPVSTIFLVAKATVETINPYFSLQTRTRSLGRNLREKSISGVKVF